MIKLNLLILAILNKLNYAIKATNLTWEYNRGLNIMTRKIFDRENMAKFQEIWRLFFDSFISFERLLPWKMCREFQIKFDISEKTPIHPGHSNSE